MVGAYSELYRSGDVVDVWGKVEFNVCEWGTVEAEYLDAGSVDAIGSVGTCCNDGLKRA